MSPKTAGAVLGLSAAAAPDPAVVAVVGCGGKTTLIGRLARECGEKKVLVSPTSKIRPPKDGVAAVCTTPAACTAHLPVPGVQYLGSLNTCTGKLEALPEPLLAEILPRYDLALLEADGSRGLPCKGWREDEPVVSAGCTHTVGVVTLSALGRPADERTVLRLPEFLALTGLTAGEAITEAALTRMVCGPEGMFRRTAGRVFLFVNRAEDPETAARAADWLLVVRRAVPGSFAGLAYGSARANQWKEV